jgi:hypothetical protein
VPTLLVEIIDQYSQSFNHFLFAGDYSQLPVLLSDLSLSVKQSSAPFA